MTDSMTFRNEDLPALFHHTDQAAISRQRESTQATRAQLMLLVAAAAAAALPEGPQLGSLRLFGLLSVLAYTGVLAVGVRATRRRARPQWQLNRSAAEFIKSLAWPYAVHGAPFGSDAGGAESTYRTRLEAGLDELRKMGWEDPRAAGQVPEGGEITGAMQRLRGLDYQVRRETYVRDRLIEQRNWYRRRTEVSRRATTVWSWTIVLLTCLALLFALFGAFGSESGAEADGPAQRGGGGRHRLERGAPPPSADRGTHTDRAGPRGDDGRHADDDHRVAVAVGGLRDGAVRVPAAHGLAGPAQQLTVIQVRGVWPGLPGFSPGSRPRAR